MRTLLYLLLLIGLINCSQKVAPQPTVIKSGSTFMPPKLPVKYMVMRNMLINQIRIADMQEKIARISSAQSRKYLLMSLEQLQKKFNMLPMDYQRFNANTVDYQRLLHRIEITQKIELLAYDDLEVLDRGGASTYTRHHRSAVSKPTGPPQKTITIGMPGSAVGAPATSTPEVITSKSGVTYPIFPVKKPNKGPIRPMKAIATPK